MWRLKFERHDIIQVTNNHFAPSMGTKMFEITKTILDLIERRESVVLFVQWKQLEDMFVQVLRQFSVEALRLSGTTSVRSAIVKKFVEEQGYILILLLDHSSAGLHLSNARHAIFAHAVVEHKNSVYEQQALGRLSLRHESDSPVHIHHFILENTREYDHWINKHKSFR